MRRLKAEPPDFVTWAASKLHHHHLEVKRGFDRMNGRCTTMAVHLIHMSAHNMGVPRWTGNERNGNEWSESE
jgi:hypothetical protein